MDSKTYSHRNGEKQEPTEEGWYWCRGTLKIPADFFEISDMLYLVGWHDGVMLTRIGSGHYVTLHGAMPVHPLGEWNCRWWGPLLAPWQEGELAEQGRGDGA